MRSVLLTLVIFAVVFTTLSLNVIDLITTDIFAYISRGALIIVLLCGVIFVGLPKFGATKTNSDEPESPERATLPQSLEENEHEK